MAVADQFETVQKLYIAFYQRPADFAGRQYWAEQVEAQGLQAVINAFATSAEATALYGDINSDTIGDVIDQIYQAAFGRAADAEGKAWYVEQFNAGTFTPATIALNVVNGAAGTDETTLGNKVQAADLFTAEVEDVAYNEADIAAARTFLEGVTDSVPTQAEVAAVVSEQIADPAPSVPGDTFTLTADVDELTGTANADTFGAGLTVSSGQTLNGFDSIDGGEGTDTLNATLTGAAGAPTLNGVEVLNLRSVNDGASVSLANATGVEQVWADRAQNNLSVTNVENLVTIGARNVTEAASVAVAVNYAANTVQASDTQAIVLNNASLLLDVQQGVDTNLSTVRNVTIDSQGTANTVDFEGNTNLLTNTAIRNLTITGAAALELDDVINATVVDASAATGDLELTVGTGNVVEGMQRSVTLGSGNDVLDISTVSLSTDTVGVYQGGEGVDRILVQTGTSVEEILANVSGFESIGLSALDSTASYATLANLGFQEVIVDAGEGGSLTNLNANSNVILTGGGEVVLALASTTGDTSFDFTVEGADGVDNSYAVTVDGVENLTINTVDTESDDGFTQTTLELTAGALKNLVLAGDEAVVFDGTTGNTDAMESVDVSGITAQSERGNIAAGLGNDEFASEITVTDATVTGSAGADLLTFGLGADVTGNAGNDVFVFATDGAATNLNFATIADFAAGDNIVFAGTDGVTDADVYIGARADLGSSAASLTQVQVSTAPGVTATFNDYLTAASGIADTGQAGEVGYFQFAGNTYLYQDNNAAGGAYNASTGAVAEGDVLIELTGLVDMSAFAVAGVAA